MKVALALGVRLRKLGPEASATVSVSLGRSASVSLAITLRAPPTKVVAVPPSATVIASVLATGSLSLTGVMVMLTVRESVVAGLGVARGWGSGSGRLSGRE